MQTRYHEIYRLAGETLKKVTGSGQEWMKYLDTAARIYKYPFEDQILIYAQKPEAAACASIKIWNEKMFCWVNRGAKGIALIDAERDWPVLHYVFDVSDVHPAKRIGKKPYIWKMETEHEDVVLKRLEKIYGETEGSLSFEGRIMELAMRIAGDYCEDLMPEIGDVKEGSFLEELDELNVEIRLRDTLSSSIAYTLLSRCGADMEIWAEELNFEYINDFNTPKIISVLGSATSELCRPILVEIGKTVTEHNKKIARESETQKSREKENNIQKEHPSHLVEKPQNNPQKGLENTEQKGYNYKQTDVRENVEHNQSYHEKKEGDAHETDIRESRGLSGSESDSGRTDGTAAHEIRQDAEEIPERTPEGDLQRDGSDGRITGSLSGDTKAGRAENGLPDGTDGRNRGRGRETESGRSDAVGGKDEQHPPRSGGKRNEGTDLRINGETESNSEVSEPDHGETTLSGSFSDGLDFAEKVMEMQKGVLCSDAFLIHKRPEIAGYFAMEQDAKLQTEYFKNSFRIGMTYVLGVGNDTAMFHAEENGIYMRDATKDRTSEETLLSWEDARFFVNSYIEDGVYLLPGEVAEKIETKGMYQQLDIFSMLSEQVGTIAMAQAETGIPLGETVSKTPEQPIPEEWVEIILRSGGGRENNRKRIYAKYQQGKNKTEMAAFLKKEYGETGKGFEFDGTQVSAWFDESGMTVGHGTSALENPELKMDWREVEEKIRSQVENGTYMDANEIYLIDDVERDRIATYISYFFYDGMGEMPEELFQKVGNRSDAHAKMVELLSEPEGIRLAARHMDDALQKLASGEKSLRFRSVMPKEELREELDNLLLEKHTFPAAESNAGDAGVDVRLEDFITMDEIDRRLGRGSSFEHGAFRIYEYFREGHDTKETVAFLKKEYGTGGQSHALPGADHSYEDHDAKGIRFRKGCIVTPYIDVLLSWKVVEKRIRKLVTQDRYLSPEGKEKYARYQEEQAQKRLEEEKERLENQTKIACKEAVEKAVADHFDGYRLADHPEDGVIQEFGAERVSYVLAYTVSCLSHDGRFSEENKEWAKGIEPKGYGHADLFISSHPAVLDGFISDVRKYIEREKELATEKIAAEIEDAEKNDVSGTELGWHIIHEADDDNGQPTQWSAKLSNGEFLWIDIETEGYALYDTHNTDASPVSISETLAEAKKVGRIML